jgi:hypothetical protein
MINTKEITRRKFNVISTKAIAAMALGGIELFVNGCAKNENLKEPNLEKKVSGKQGSVLEDDFTEINPKIWKKIIIGEAYLSTTHKGLKLAVKSTANKSKQSNSEIWNHGRIFKYNTAEILLKRENLEYGSCGWGFWNYSMDISNSQQAWFAYSQGPKNHPMRGFWATTRNGKNKEKVAIKGISLEDYHTYKINWKKDRVNFFIDGVQVAEIAQNVPQGKMGFDAWIDNVVWVVQNNQYRRTYQDIGDETALHLDRLVII